MNITTEEFRKAKEALEKANVPCKHLYLTKDGLFSFKKEEDEDSSKREF